MLVKKLGNPRLVLGGDPIGKSFFAKETESGVFSVGNEANNGKFENSSDGFSFLFRQIAADQNFKINVKATIIATTGKSQAGFGLRLRDDCIIGQSGNGTISSNYVTAGLLCGSSSTTALFYRENATLSKGSSFGAYAVGDVFDLTIERVGQAVTVTVTCGESIATTTHTDFDFFARDTEFMYVGMFANRGTVVEFSNVQFEITGTSQGA